jgi:hypothetical protein
MAESSVTFRCELNAALKPNSSNLTDTAAAHLRVLAQRFEAANKEVRTMGSQSELLRTTHVTALSGKDATFGVQSRVLEWRTREDSNL